MIGTVLSFYINNNLFGINITLIREINRNVEYTPVPDAKPYIVGLFNMRGQVVTLFDISKLMGIKEGDHLQRTTCIILKAPANDPNQIGFLIDKPGDVIDLEKEECEIPPANVVGIEGEYINSVVKLKDRLLMIIDPEKIFNV